MAISPYQMSNSQFQFPYQMPVSPQFQQFCQMPKSQYQFPYQMGGQPFQLPYQIPPNFLNSNTSDSDKSEKHKKHKSKKNHEKKEVGYLKCQTIMKIGLPLTNVTTIRL